jgi:hypothetical protein
MSIAMPASETTRSPLEQFLRDYVEAADGVWDEIEPQVYDLMLPPAADDTPGGQGEPAVLRLTFDPEALPEHPQAQLASFGTPLIERLLQAALHRGQGVELYRLGLNLQPHQLAQRLHRAVKLADPASDAQSLSPNRDVGRAFPPVSGLGIGSKTAAARGGEPARLEIQRVRPLLFPQVVFWFEATFVSDQKEQEVLPLAIDLHYGRQVRHLDQLLDPAQLGEHLSPALPEVPGISRAEAYRLASEQIVRTVAALANTRARELTERLDRQAARMTKYYADLADELDEQQQRAAARGADDPKFGARREALERERELRLSELRRKNALSVRLRLLNLLVIRQPKLLVQAAVTAGTSLASLDLVYDPLLETVEPPPCPACRRPTFELRPQRGSLVCPACVTASVPLRKTKPR